MLPMIIKGDGLNGGVPKVYIENIRTSKKR